MATRDTQATLVAAYQFMASYLVWDLRDLLKEGSLRSGAARDRVKQFIEMLTASARAAEPVYPATQAERSATGSARAERTRRLISLSRDEQLFDLLLAARGDADLEDATAWARHAREVLESVVERGWKEPDGEGERRFIHDDIEDFLRRLQRVDQLDEYRPARRSNLKRR